MAELELSDLNNEFEILFLVGQDNLRFKKKNEFIIYIGSHGDSGAECADIIFPEALETEEEFKLFAESVNGDMLANMTEFGKTPYYPAEKFADMGYKIIIYPVSSLRIALDAISDLFDEIMKTGTQVKFVEDMLTRKDLYNLINYDSYVKMDESLGGDDLISK